MGQPISKPFMTPAQKLDLKEIGEHLDDCYDLLQSTKIFVDGLAVRNQYKAEATKLSSNITFQLDNTYGERMERLKAIPGDTVAEPVASRQSCCTTTGNRIATTLYTSLVFWVVASFVAFIALFSKTADVLHDIPAEYWTLFHGSLQWIYLGVAVMAVLGGFSLCYSCLKK